MKGRPRISGIIALAAVLGLLTSYLIWRYLRERSIEYGQPVVLVRVEIRPRTQIERSMLAVGRRLPGEIPGDALTDVDAAVGRTAARLLRPMDTLHQGDLLSHNRPDALAFLIDPEKRAITIGASEISTVAGMVRPEDRVDVLVSYPDPVTQQQTTVPVLQKVRVLAVNKGMMDPEGGGASSSLTLEVPPREGVMLTAADRIGALRVMLRPVGDERVIDLDPTTADDFVGRQILEAISRVSSNGSPAAVRPRHIEVYAGTQGRPFPVE